MMEVNFCRSHDMESEYEKLIRRMNPPMVIIDNDACNYATVIKVDRANKHGTLLEVVQVLTDLNLIITKAYITFDCGWFMDVFKVTDHDGQRIRDERMLDYIKMSLGPDSCFARPTGVSPSLDCTVIKLSGGNRSGLLSEVSAVLTHRKCSVVESEVWCVTDEETGFSLTDPDKLSSVKQLLCNLLKGSHRYRPAKVSVSPKVTHTERRLTQTLALWDYKPIDHEDLDEKQRPSVNVDDWYEKGYSVVTIRCKDRPELLFDTVRTLTDMEYVVFHGSIDAEGPEAYQEYYIRHVDGSPVKSDAERERVIQCLEAVIERRVDEELQLELSGDRVGLLSEVTHIFQEFGLTVTRAQVATRVGKAIDTFYVRGASGHPVDHKTIDSIRHIIGQTVLKAKASTGEVKSAPLVSPTKFLFGGLFKSRSYGNFGLVRSCS